MTEAIVVGAGLSGLRAASILHHAGVETLVVEAESHIGGRVRTGRVDGYAIDEGFQVLLTAMLMHPSMHSQGRVWTCLCCSG